MWWGLIFGLLFAAPVIEAVEDWRLQRGVQKDLIDQHQWRELAGGRRVILLVEHQQTPHRRQGAKSERRRPQVCWKKPTNGHCVIR